MDLESIGKTLGPELATLATTVTPSQKALIEKLLSEAAVKRIGSDVFDLLVTDWQAKRNVMGELQKLFDVLAASVDEHTTNVLDKLAVKQLLATTLNLINMIANTRSAEIAARNDEKKS